MADKAQALEKDNSSLRSQVSKAQSELHAKDSVIDRLEQQCRDLAKMRDSGKDLVKQEVDKMEEEIRRERKEHEKSLREALAKVKEFEGQLTRVRNEALELKQAKESIKETVRGALMTQIHSTIGSFKVQHA